MFGILEGMFAGLEFRVSGRGVVPMATYQTTVDLRIPSAHISNPPLALYKLVFHVQGTPTHTNTKTVENGITIW